MYRGRFIPREGVDEPAHSPAAASRGRNLRELDSTAHAIHGLRRIACILVVDFPIAALMRANPELRDQPLALTRMPSAQSSPKNAGPRRCAEYQPHSELSHVAMVAQAAGINTGMTVAQARAILPGLIVMHPSPAAEQAAIDALATAAESLSPVIEEGSPGCVWLDLTGMERVHRHVNSSMGSEEDAEPGLAEEIARRIHQIGLEAAVGIASSKEIAHLAARCGGKRVIPSGREREFLDWMPLELTDLGTARDELELKLKRLGLQRLGDLARIDLNAFGSRLGKAGVALARLARGEGSSTVIAGQRTELFVETIELDYGIDNLEPLSFIMHAMLQRLCARLQLRGLAASAITLSLGLSNCRRDERRVAVDAPTSEVHSLLVLLNLSLAAGPPAAAIESLRLALTPIASRAMQDDMFLPSTPAPERLETAVARIAALCGPDRVGVLLPAKSYRPEAVQLGKFAPHTTANPASKRIGASSARMALRTLRPAEEIEVLCTRATPKFVRGKNLCARVISCAGPWRYQGEWWAESLRSEPASTAWQASAPTPYARDYYEVALADGGVYRIFRDRLSARWYVDGVYD
jgi:protein ImuB